LNEPQNHPFDRDTGVLLPGSTVVNRLPESIVFSAFEPYRKFGTSVHDGCCPLMLKLKNPPNFSQCDPFTMLKLSVKATAPPPGT
jgi:hypothetical protein